MPMEELPERHIECSECKKPIHTIYTEAIGKTIYRLGMCRDCPILKQKLHGLQTPTGSDEKIASGLCCGSCQTSVDEVTMGSALGCSLCYEVFDDTIHQEILLQERLPQTGRRMKRPAAIHIGRRPGQHSEVNPATKLHSLHQALHETLAKEDYEAAAWLRDQIKALTDQSQTPKESDEHTH